MQHIFDTPAVRVLSHF